MIFIAVIGMAGLALHLGLRWSPLSAAVGQETLKPSKPEHNPTRRSTTDNSLTLDQFEEVSAQSGIHFALTSGGSEKRYIIEAKGGGGIAWIDYDNDGFPDLFLVNGSTYEQWRKGTNPRSALFHNNGNGTFTDVSKGSGLDRTGWGMGVCVRDYDNWFGHQKSQPRTGLRRLR